MEQTTDYAPSNAIDNPMFVYIISFNRTKERPKRAIMIAPQDIPVMLADINGAIDEQGQGKADLTENSEEAEDEKARFFSADNIDFYSVNQETQKVEEEQRQAHIEDFD